MVQHLVINNTNDHLQNAIEKYGKLYFCRRHPLFFDLVAFFRDLQINL
jgi:hypothetical protein